MMRVALVLALVATSASAEPVAPKPTCSLPKLEQKATVLLKSSKTRAAYSVAHEMVSCRATPRSYAMLALTGCKMYIETRNRRIMLVATRALAKLSAMDQQRVAAACAPRECGECQLE